MTDEYIGALVALAVGTAFALYMVARRPATIIYLGDSDDMGTAFEEEVLPAFTDTTPEKAAYVKQLRAAARHLAALNPDGITADDLHDACPVPKGIEPRIMGAAFPKEDGWVKAGWVQSRRKINHGRPIMKWVRRTA